MRIQLKDKLYVDQLNLISFPVCRYFLRTFCSGGLYNYYTNETVGDYVIYDKVLALTFDLYLFDPGIQVQSRSGINSYLQTYETE